MGYSHGQPTPPHVGGPWIETTDGGLVASIFMRVRVDQGVRYQAASSRETWAGAHVDRPPCVGTPRCADHIFATCHILQRR
jgi:hypothetical protein